MNHHKVRALGSPPVMTGIDYVTHERDEHWSAMKMIDGVLTTVAFLVEHQPGDFSVFTDDAALVKGGMTIDQYGRSNLRFWKCTGLGIAGDAVTISKTTAITSKITLETDTIVNVGDVIRQGGKDTTVTVATQGKGVEVDTTEGFSAGAATHHRKSTHVATLAVVPKDPASVGSPWPDVNGVVVTEAVHTIPSERDGKGEGMITTFEAEDISVVA